MGPLSLDKNDFFRVRILEGTHVTVEKAAAMTKAMKDLAEGKRLPVMYYNPEKSTVEPECVDYVLSNPDFHAAHRIGISINPRENTDTATAIAYYRGKSHRYIEQVPHVFFGNADKAEGCVEKYFAEDKVATLTDRERKVLAWLMMDKPREQIWKDLNISNSTLSLDQNKIEKKLGTSAPFMMLELIRISKYRDEFYAEFYKNPENLWYLPPSDEGNGEEADLDEKE